MTTNAYEVTRPEEAHHAPERVIDEETLPEDHELEAAELRSYSSQVSDSSLRRRTAGETGHAKLRLIAIKAKISKTRRLWRDHVSLHVPHNTCRDHLALERTYLSYVRTSLALSNLGVITCQLFRLATSSNPAEADRYYRFGRPLANLSSGISIVVCLLGGWRFYRQQNALARGKIRASGWELALIAAFIAIVISLLFVVTVAVTD